MTTNQTEIQAKILLDSLAPCGERLTTFECTYPRFIHSEIMTHRALSKNSASSRAIPSEKMRAMIKERPALPVWWGKNQAGMQAFEELDDEVVYTRFDDIALWSHNSTNRQEAKKLWLEARDVMLKYSDKLAALGLHKQLCNRLTEPWMPITVIISATEWQNFFFLRTHKAAQPEFQVLAKLMKKAYDASTPRVLSEGQWHLPLIHDEDAREAQSLVQNQMVKDGIEDPTSWCLQGRSRTVDLLKKVSVGRCARVSYLTHDGRRDLEEDIKLHDRLISGLTTGEPLHLSPFEHVAMALSMRKRSGNFVGFHQYRKDFCGEAGPGVTTSDAS